MSNEDSPVLLEVLCLETPIAKQALLFLSIGFAIGPVSPPFPSFLPHRTLAHDQRWREDVGFWFIGLDFLPDYFNGPDDFFDG
jgi:hypothetical protein